MPETTQQVDHKAEALKLVERAAEDSRQVSYEAAEHSLKLALVHSNLAIAEGQERVAEALEKIDARYAKARGWNP